MLKKIHKKVIKSPITYQIFEGHRKLFESNDKEAVTSELSRLNSLPSETNDRKVYDLRIKRDTSIKKKASPLLAEPWQR